VVAMYFSTGVNKYIDETQIDQVIVFPRKQKLFESLFSSDNTRKLAYHSHVPVITVHD
jgi:hypothetical protein